MMLIDWFWKKKLDRAVRKQMKRREEKAQQRIATMVKQRTVGKPWKMLDVSHAEWNSLMRRSVKEARKHIGLG